MSYEFPCKECTKRYPGCSDHCEEYQEVKAYKEKLKAKRQKESIYTGEWHTYIYEHSNRMRRRHGR